MQCKYCNYPDSKVVDTTHDDKNNQIYRRRECVKCGARYSTTEHFREGYKLGRPPYKTTPPNKVLPK